MSDLAAVREEQRELRAMQREAVTDWLRIRRQKGIAAYSDKRALGWLRIVVDQTYRTEEWRDIQAAVREIAATPGSSPWAIRGKAYELAARRRAIEHAERMRAERDGGYGTGV